MSSWSSIWSVHILPAVSALIINAASMLQGDGAMAPQAGTITAVPPIKAQCGVRRRTASCPAPGAGPDRCGGPHCCCCGCAGLRACSSHSGGRQVLRTWRPPVWTTQGSCRGDGHAHRRDLGGDDGLLGEVSPAARPLQHLSAGAASAASSAQAAQGWQAGAAGPAGLHLISPPGLAMVCTWT